MRHLFHSSAFAAVLSLLLAACAPTPASAPTSPSPTATTAAVEPLPTRTAPPPAPTITVDLGLVAPPPLSFIAQTYTDDAYGFELDYPTGWTASPNLYIGSRGSSTQIFSPGATAEYLPPGGTRLSLTIYMWDPKNDLAAYADHRKIAWEASGFQILSESSGVLADGRQNLGYTVQTAEGLRTYLQFTTLGQDYLEISGEGDLELIREIAATVRPTDFQP